MNLIHHEHGSISIGSHDQEDHQYGQAFSVGMVHHMDTYDVLTSHHEDTFAGFLVLDSGCQRTCLRSEVVALPHEEATAACVDTLFISGR